MILQVYEYKKIGKYTKEINILNLENPEIIE